MEKPNKCQNKVSQLLGLLHGEGGKGGRGVKALRNSTGLCNIIDDIIAQWGQQRQKQHNENANEKLAATPKEQQQQ